MLFLFILLIFLLLFLFLFIYFLFLLPFYCFLWFRLSFWMSISPSVPCHQPENITVYRFVRFLVSANHLVMSTTMLVCLSVCLSVCLLKKKKRKKKERKNKNKNKRYLFHNRRGRFYPEGKRRPTFQFGFDKQKQKQKQKKKNEKRSIGNVVSGWGWGRWKIIDY